MSVHVPLLLFLTIYFRVTISQIRISPLHHCMYDRTILPPHHSHTPHRYYGPESLQTALTYHLLARVHSFLGDFRAALHHEKLTYNIYTKKVREYCQLNAYGVIVNIP